MAIKLARTELFYYRGVNWSIIKGGGWYHPRLTHRFHCHPYHTVPLVTCLEIISYWSLWLFQYGIKFIGLFKPQISLMIYQFYILDFHHLALVQLQLWMLLLLLSPRSQIQLWRQVILITTVCPLSVVLRASVSIYHMRWLARTCKLQVMYTIVSK